MKSSPTASPFDTKVAGLIDATAQLSIAQILVVRRLTLSDPESLRWSTPHQLNVVFDVILGRALERMDRRNLMTARDQNMEPLLPPKAQRDPDDVTLLERLLGSMLGPAPSAGQTEWQRTQAEFEALLSRRLPPTPPRIPRLSTPSREPLPLFAAQGGMKSTSAARNSPKSAQMEGEAEGKSGNRGHSQDFESLFDDTLVEHIRKILELLCIPPANEATSARSRLPFLSAPEFQSVFEDVMREFILPTIRKSRHVQTMSQTYNWSQVGGEQIIEIIHTSEVNNPILHNWDGYWNNIKEEKVKKGVDSPWARFRDDATRCRYVPPSKEDVRLMMDMIRFEPESIDKAWRELEQLYQQEFTPGGRQERAREGAFRDGILKWSARLPDHLSEFLAIKAHYSFIKLDGNYMRALVANFGRTESERFRNAPYLSQFVMDMN